MVDPAGLYLMRHCFGQLRNGHFNLCLIDNFPDHSIDQRFATIIRIDENTKIIIAKSVCGNPCKDRNMPLWCMAGKFIRQSLRTVKITGHGNANKKILRARFDYIPSFTHIPSFAHIHNNWHGHNAVAQVVGFHRRGQIAIMMFHDAGKRHEISVRRRFLRHINNPLLNGGREVSSIKPS
ncbi:putative serine/threonine protein kinase [Candidatus Puniceispirillum marinum IMCC1322]|uniref:Putative serine/threonine protein kinase n=1 Tax=Puniceispirillum marinum (strain IMCC1322) TaxID=488538 RepID=D5BN44_PUNMI|nr:putative serine/threonine protein kinase [Candidatus Puniceispirillum marinum IMCC1322]